MISYLILNKLYSGLNETAKFDFQMLIDRKEGRETNMPAALNIPLLIMFDLFNEIIVTEY